MKPITLARLAAVLLFQILLMWGMFSMESSSAPWQTNLIGGTGLVLSFTGYLAVLYRATILPGWTRYLRAAVLAAVSVALAFAAMMAAALCHMYTGGKAEMAKMTPARCYCETRTWGRYSPPDGSFTIWMPVPPKRHVTTNMMAKGISLFATNYISDIGQSYAFTVVCSGVPAGADQGDTSRFFQASRNKVVNGGAKMISEHELFMHGWPGREWQFEKFNGLIGVRVYLTSQGVFQAICGMPTNNVCDRHLREFLDSFDLRVPAPAK